MPFFILNAAAVMSLKLTFVGAGVSPVQAISDPTSVPAESEWRFTPLLATCFPDSDRDLRLDPIGVPVSPITLA